MEEETKERPSYYSVIPASVRYDENLKANEKLLYSEITVLCNKNGYCYASNEYFAELYDVHKNTISIWINNLKKCGYIGTKILYKEDKKTIDKRIIWIAEVILREIAQNYCENHKGGINEIIDRYIQNHLYPINENIKENNTSINNLSTTIIKDNTTSNYIINSNKGLFEIIQENLGRLLNGFEIEKIEEWQRSCLDNELIIYAVKKTFLKGIYNFNYIDKILYSWEKNNIKTLQQAQEEEKKFEERKKTNKNNYQRKDSKQEQRKRALERARQLDELERQSKGYD